MCDDVVIFDPGKVMDKATFTKPHQFPDGIPYVIVNGKLAVDNSEWTGVFAGKVLYGAGRK